MTRSPSIVLALAVLTACPDPSVDDTGDPLDTGTEDTATTPDAPHVTAVQPAQDERGVTIDTPIVIAFSEPMSTASVEAAWISESLPKDEITFSWDSTGTLLTIDVSGVVEYAESAIDGDSYGYAFTIDGTATDAEGDALDGAFTSQFDTARRIRTSLPLLGGGTGSLFSSGSAISPLRVGDEAFQNRSWRAFVTLDTAVMVGVVAIESATLSLDQDSVSGEPFGELGTVTAMDIEPVTTIDAVALTAVARSEIGTLSTTATPGLRTLDIADALDSALDDGHDAMTVRLQFDSAFSDDADDDYVVFEDVSVALIYLAD